jgi:hypothetical protein
VDFKGRVYTNIVWIRLDQDREQWRYLAEQPVVSQDETVKYPSVCLCPPCLNSPKWRVVGKKMVQKKCVPLGETTPEKLSKLLLHACVRVQDDFSHYYFPYTKSNGTVNSMNTQSPCVYGNNCDEICLH